MSHCSHCMQTGSIGTTAAAQHMPWSYPSQASAEDAGPAADDVIDLT